MRFFILLAFSLNAFSSTMDCVSTNHGSKYHVLFDFNEMVISINEEKFLIKESFPSSDPVPGSQHIKTINNPDSNYSEVQATMIWLDYYQSRIPERDTMLYFSHSKGDTGLMLKCIDSNVYNGPESYKRK